MIDKRSYEYCSEDGQRCVSCAIKPMSRACKNSRKKFSVQCGLNAEHHNKPVGSIIDMEF